MTFIRFSDASRLFESAGHSYRLGQRAVDASVELKINELRRKYKEALDLLILQVCRPGMKRVYVPELKRELLVGPDNKPLAAIWVEWPKLGEFLVVIRTEIYANTPAPQNGHGCGGSA